MIDTHFIPMTFKLNAWCLNMHVKVPSSQTTLQRRGACSQVGRLLVAAVLARGGDERIMRLQWGESASGEKALCSQGAAGGGHGAEAADPGEESKGRRETSRWGGRGKGRGGVPGQGEGRELKAGRDYPGEEADEGDGPKN